MTDPAVVDWASDDDELACAAALAGLPKLNSERLRWLMTLGSRPSLVWERLRSRRLPRSRVFPDGTLRSWGRYVDATTPADVLARCRRAGVQVLLPCSADYPARLVADPEAPAVLFCAGDPGVVAGRTVAIVGTRRATGYGRDAARMLGRRLSAEGISVVSGLASGIDAAAQRGALAAGGGTVVGVAGSGLDVVYPPESADLWRALRDRGVLLSEAPMGCGGNRWRFPERNRLMAALADAVVVVETPLRGGSLSTVEHALRRDVPVMAVPGPITSNPSAGTNRLLADGAGVVCDAEDVLLQIGVAPSGRGRRSRRPRPQPAPEDRPVLEALDPTPTPFDRVLARTNLAPLELASALYRLEAQGLARAGPGWWERRAG